MSGPDVEVSCMSERIAVMQAILAQDRSTDRLLGSSAAIVLVRQTIGRVAPTDATVLLTGESGTGKEVAAREIHRRSARRDGPFVPVNCGAIAPGLVESELFGHERGSFTGALRGHAGVFERAAGGTLFLDEVTEMPLELQPRLLRAIETGRVQRVGGAGEIPTNVRIVAATNRDPSAAVAAGRLRADLLYRLAVFPLPLPALRERPGDALVLAEAFVAALNARYGLVKRLSGASRDRIPSYAWPGNVRELRNAVERAYILSDVELDVGDDMSLPRVGASIGTQRLDIRVGMSLAEAERALVEATLERTGGNKSEAARLLGCSLRTLYNKLHLYADAAAG